MKTVTITIEPGDFESSNDHDLECLATVNGRQYHDSLREIRNILISCDRKRKLTPEARELLDEIRSRSAVHFKGVYDGPKK